MDADTDTDTDSDVDVDTDSDTDSDTEQDGGDTSDGGDQGEWSDEVDGTAIVDEEVNILDEELFADAVIGTDFIEFPISAADQVAALRIGDIILRNNAEHSMLRHILGITTTADKIMVTTENAGIAQLFKEADFKLTLPLNESYGPWINSDLSGTVFGRFTIMKRVFLTGMRPSRRVIVNATWRPDLSVHRG